MHPLTNRPKTRLHRDRIAASMRERYARLKKGAEALAKLEALGLNSGGGR